LGIYQEDQLIKSITSKQKTSEVLVSLIMDALEEYPITQILYTHGPGSYMSIKLTYIMLKTIEIVRDIEFVGVDAFSFNDAQPIKALGSLYFVKEKSEIITKKFDEKIEQTFTLPQTINHLTLSDNQPLYILPAV
jgi:tRNA A37 threonylcarbamoyladenosine modification protein TsaB